MAKFVLSHDAQDIDDTIDEVQAARGSEASLSAKIATKQDTLTFDSTPTADSSNPVTSAGIKTALTNLYSSIFGLGEEIPANADLNSYLKPGRYYGGNDAGNTVANFPIANGRFGFTVKVEQMTATNFYQYVYICNQANDGYIYRRRYLASSQTFNPWYRFDGSSLQSAQTAPASLMQAGRIDAELTDAGNDEEEEER
jgi:hypothetical protein